MENNFHFICLCLNVILPTLIIFTSLGAVIYGIKYKKAKTHKYTYEWVYTIIIGIYLSWAVIFSFVLFNYFYPIDNWSQCLRGNTLVIFIRPAILLTTTAQYILNKLKYLKTIRYNGGANNGS